MVGRTKHVYIGTAGRPVILYNAASGKALIGLLKEHEAGGKANMSKLHSWLGGLISQVNHDRYRLDLEHLIKQEPILITHGKLELISDAKLCAVLMLSDPDEYQGGEHNGEKLPQGAAMFYKPEDYTDFEPVTEGVCKAFYFAAS